MLPSLTLIISFPLQHRNPISEKNDNDNDNNIFHLGNGNPSKIVYLFGCKSGLLK
jgi:hypothetical protein